MLCTLLPAHVDNIHHKRAHFFAFFESARTHPTASLFALAEFQTCHSGPSNRALEIYTVNVINEYGAHCCERKNTQMFIIARWKIGWRSVVVLFLRYLCFSTKSNNFYLWGSFESLYFILTLFLPLTLEIGSMLSSCARCLPENWACASFMNANTHTDTFYQRQWHSPTKDKWITN